MNAPTPPSIPRLIHRVWLDDPMPPKFAEFGKEWRRLHPGWRFQDWTDSAEVDDDFWPAVALRRRAKEILPKDWKRFVADVLRLEILYVYGGVYVDTDVEPHRNLGLLLGGHEFLAASSPQHVHGVHPVTQCFLASQSGHPFLGALLSGLDVAVEEYADRSLAQMVGPWHLTRTLRDHPDAPDWDVTILDSTFFTRDDRYLSHYWNTRRRRKGKALGGGPGEPLG